MENFTPISALIGGGLIGLSTVLMMGLHGRITGITGICDGALFGEPGERTWRLAFILGLLLAPIVFTVIFGQAPLIQFDVGLPMLIAGGFLTGLGTRLGRGCTSGHGVCGLARLSFPSLVAVLTFMGAGIATVYVTRHMMGG